MDKKIQFLMVGGFLGAGKTTLLSRIARHYMAQGLSVGLITNDQATDLVDTESLRISGFAVGEVAGACFCCNFNRLVETVSQLEHDHAPDVVIAEPVGSCTDLVATVLDPLLQLHGDSLELGPLVVLCKPEHGRKILGSEPAAGFSPDAEYIFLKQLEEADIIAVNKVDKLSPADCRSLTQLVEHRFPAKPVLAISARQGDGFDDLMTAIDTTESQTHSQMAVDYDRYAAGEAELGWLNGQLHLQSERTPFSLDEIVLWFVSRLGARLTAEGAETAHIKLLGQCVDAVAIANQVSGDERAELSRRSDALAEQADLILNARVAATPQLLESTVRSVGDELRQQFSVQTSWQSVQCFQPARPEPTHRSSAD